MLAWGLAMGVVLETLQQKAGWVSYVPGWPHPVLAPAWILALWGAFALMSIDGLAWLRGKRLLAGLFGAVGAPVCILFGNRLGGRIRRRCGFLRSGGFVLCGGYAAVG